MPFNSLFDYTASRDEQDAAVRIHGVPVTLFTPLRPIQMQGYEDEADYAPTKVLCRIDFHPARRVFYHFNWFPEGEDQVTAAYFLVEQPIAQDSIIRTKTIEQVSPYGDLLFKVVKIFDEGMYHVLKRTVFLAAISDSSAYERFKVTV